ncbi:hypothetical protein QBC34DRAFT_219327 [Podospora aff. communis PSN243]|uniref:Uncharacterized protein n=1 Tax=Podospora aff. communis PSN243 TaxID=3040156 RepID=A0AAV9GY91_9PEZI|nr:hypothetical protein QBC34DRAFT_219327 [Podospora aff. communis PSN243]
MASPQAENTTPGQGPDLKSRLDEASSRSRQPQHSEDTSKMTRAAIVDKVSQYIPAVKKIVGEREESEPGAETAPKNEGPPDRPNDDTKIGQFLRDQHRSMPIDKRDE